MNTMALFQFIIMVMLFYSASITTLTYALPESTIHYVDSFDDLSNKVNMSSVQSNIEESIESEINIPLVELGALVFYSGNIIIDLMLNFFFSVPQMLALLLSGINMLFNFNEMFIYIAQTFVTVLVSVMYFLGIMQLIANIRAGGKVI